MAYTTDRFLPLTWALVKQNFPKSQELIMGGPWVHKLPLRLESNIGKLFYFFDAHSIMVLITGHPTDLGPVWYSYTVKYPRKGGGTDWVENRDHLFATRGEAETAAFTIAFGLLEKRLKKATK